MSWLGIDIGGTEIKSCLITNEEKIIKELNFPTPHDLDSLLQRFIEIYENLSTNEKIEGAGIGIAGFIDINEWVLRSSPNMKFLDGINLLDYFGSKINIPFIVDNDANMAAWGEFKIGAGTEVKNMVHVTLGTGVGSGIIIDGKLFHGSTGFGAELGHTVVNPEGIPCNCGGRGCLETEASAQKIVKNYLDLIGKETLLTSKEVYDFARNGDERAIEAFRKAGYYLGIGLANVINLLNPELIVLGGGVMNAGDLIMKPVLEEIRKRAISFPFNSLKIVPALLGNKAGMIGAALWAMENLS
ncbi:MAG: ROK family protein [Candidatus Aminicenantia bacterium]